MLLSPSLNGLYFPSFSEGLSLRRFYGGLPPKMVRGFPFLFGGTFIEASPVSTAAPPGPAISLPFRRDFH